MIELPCDEFVASFVGVETILTGKVIRSRTAELSWLSVEGSEIEAVGEAPCGGDGRPLHPAGKRDPFDEPFEGNDKRPECLPGKDREELLSWDLIKRVQLDCGFPLVAYVTQSFIGKVVVERKEKR